MKSPAILLDRDGTIIEDVGYIDDPDEVRLLSGAANAIRRFSELGYLVVVVSNQSGVARGYFDEEILGDIHAAMEDALLQENAQLDGAYYCPYLDGPDAVVDAYRRDSELRKPKPGMLLQAASDLDIDLNRSWMIGDSQADIEAGQRAGCRTLLVQASGIQEQKKTYGATKVIKNLAEAVDFIVVGKTESTMAAKPKPTTPEPGKTIDGSVQVLQKILAQLEGAQREHVQDDFSILRLFGALLQMFAIVVAIWGLINLLNENDVAATSRFALACFFELASLSAFAIDRFR